MNRHLLVGHVEGDVQKFPVGEKSKFSFRLAESGGKSFHTVVVWEGDTTVPKAGDLVFVEGRVTHRSYEKGEEKVKTWVTETTASAIDILGAAAQTADDEGLFGD